MNISVNGTTTSGTVTIANTAIRRHHLRSGSPVLMILSFTAQKPTGAVAPKAQLQRNQITPDSRGATSAMCNKPNHAAMIHEHAATDQFTWRAGFDHRIEVPITATTIAATSAVVISISGAPCWR